MSSARSSLFSLEQIGIKLGLEQIRALVEALGRPDRAFRSIVVAGTNGKGSVSAMLERGLRAAGYRTGRYTSPHLVELEERFAVDGQQVSKDTLDLTAERIMRAADGLPAPPTFFEATTALAFELFRDAGVELAVLEVGLGGRLDATNVVQPIAVAITAIDFDHEQFLGSTIESIAGEKAGVIKQGALVVLAENSPAAEGGVADACSAASAVLVRAAAGVHLSSATILGRTALTVTTPRGGYEELVLGLRGQHQIQNALVAIRLLEEMSAAGLVDVPSAAIRTAVEDVVWPARLELLRWRDHEVLIDGAHNPAGARALAEYVLATYARRLPMVIALMRDKKIDEAIGAFARAASAFVFTAPDTPRAARPADLLASAARVAPDVPASVSAGPIDALTRAASLGSPVVVAGSLYLAGEIRAQIS